MASNTAWGESTVKLTGGWDMAAAPSSARSMLHLSDAGGGSCSWSMSSAPIAGEGVAFSGKLVPGEYRFDAPVPSGAVYVQGVAGTILTVLQA